MGEEVKMTDYDTNGEEEEEEEEEEEDNYDGIADNNGVDDDDERVQEWEAGLPEAGDLTPLSQALIPPELASAFSISPAPCRTLLDVNRASQTTLSNLRGGCSQLNALSSNNFKSFSETRTRDPMATDGEEMANGNHNKESNNNENFVGPGRVEGSGSESRNNKMRKIESEEADSAAMRTAEEDPSSAAMRSTVKRPRLVWTPQLHKRFVDVVAHLGIKNAVPKTIMQLMNVEGLTRENVASHLQKYRLYLKRMQGLSTEGPSSSDHLFASTPVPQSLRETGGGSGSGGGGGGCGGGGGGGGGGGAGGPNGHMGMPIPMPYHQGPMMPIPMYGLPHMQMGNNGSDHQYRHHLQQFDGNYGYNGMLQQRDWSGNNHGSVISYPRHPHPHHVAPQDNM